ncbi:IclR family transcriptional regulator [Achromobacter seleniivolatilans]|uniref:IclR family transcriptional regulator n=1 Tax=Achromobacter seleniivolatilans TaxID=3047478 RepID=A0ABY9LU37_9BURK|nr:IclR family transcriptional regulator [Achromobacter sp. R39]WMD18125.1 IclR family transcriptional regulator [Achromobacter sp. R39]
MSTLKRALAILDLFSLDTPVLTAEDIISRLAYSAPTGYRYIRDLSDLGYLLRMTGGGYKLGPRIIELDHLIIDGDPVLGVARPIMREVVDQVGGDVLLSVIHGLRILNIHHERGPDALGIPHGRGRAHPLFRGATAKTIIAFLPRKDQRRLYDDHVEEVHASGLGDTLAAFTASLDAIRVQGFYLGVGEISSERAGIAVPVFQEDRRIFGALTVTFLATRLNTIAQDKTTALLQSAARRIESLALATRIKEQAPAP